MLKVTILKLNLGGVFPIWKFTV